VILAVALAVGLRVAAPNDAAPANPVAQIARQLDDHRLVMIGEFHRWQELHAFLQRMLRDPTFICRVDDVVVEFGNSRLQPIADAYGSGADVPEARVQSMWRETAVPLTWNSPVYRQFYDAVRELNQAHLCPHPVRIVLGDPPLDWSKIKTVQDYAPWTDRDGSLATVVEREVLAKGRRALVLAGIAHAVKRGGDEGPAAAELIERKHPGALFSIVPIRSPATAAAMKMPAPPSFRTVRASELAGMDFALISKVAPGKRVGEVVDGVLYVGDKETSVYPPPTIYLDPAYERELRRRAAIHKAYSGQDFLPVIDELLRSARQQPRP